MRKFFYLMAMVCTLGFFTACSSDDDPTIWDTFKAGDYQVWGDALNIDEDDVENNLVDYKINVSRVDDTKAKVVINATAEGTNVGTITVPEALIQQKGTDVVISGEGTAVMADDKTTTKATANNDADTEKAKVTLTISSDNKASLELEMDGNTYKATNDQKPASANIIGTWYVQESQFDPTTYAMTGSVKINWEGDEEKAVFENFMGSTEPYAFKDALDMLSMFGNSQLPNVLKSVTFTTDGKIIALYKDAESTTADASSTGWKVAEDYATYTAESEDLINVSLNISKITEGIKDAQLKSMIEGILNQYKQIPVHISWDAKKTKPYFYVDKAFVQPMIANLVGIISKVPTGGMDEEDLAMFNMVKEIAVQLPTIMDATTKLELGLELTK